MKQRDSLTLKSKLIVGQMAMAGIKLSTISFYMGNAVLLERKSGVTLLEMTSNFKFSRAGANRHLKTLKELGIVEKCSYHNWRLTLNPLRDIDFLEILKTSFNGLRQERNVAYASG